MINIEEKYVFHVHTSRCGHASYVADEAYVKRAIELGADSITFTDHAPFPGDPFTGRMKYYQLKEYISSLKQLKERYAGTINIFSGLEIEYLPFFKTYYEELKANENIDVLMIGQHHYQCGIGIYGATYNYEIPGHMFADHIGLCDAMIEGMDTGLFDIVAHPDRVFKNYSVWNDMFAAISCKVIRKAVEKNIYLEKNYSSMRKENLYRPDFWKLVPKSAKIIYGCDAHSVDELVTVPASKKWR